MKVKTQAICLDTQDNQTLRAYSFIRGDINHQDIKGKVLIASAMGVEQVYYRAIATWLAEQGYLVLTFDCRAMGESKTQHLKFYRNNISDWAKYDYSAALNYLLEESTPCPIYWLGHSLGGQIFPLVEKIDQVTKVITISSGTGYWKHNVPQLKRIALPFWYLVVPLATTLLGYFPGKKLGMVGDLPKRVIYQWRRWCMQPDYCVSETKEVQNQFEQLSVPLHSICFTDDEMLSINNIRDLHKLFGNQNKRLSVVNPKSENIKRVGHLGFFREKFKDTLWCKFVLEELSQNLNK